MARELKMEKGRIDLLGERIQFIPTRLCVDMLKNADDFWATACLQYQSAKSSIHDWFEEVATRKGLKLDKLVEWEVNVFNLAGWGQYEFEVTQLLKGRAVIEVKDSCFAERYLKAYGKSEYPICHLTRGGVAGGANLLNKRDDLEIVEVKCLAQGYPQCELLLKPRAEFLDTNNESYRRQLNL